jgi:hypothetical protein
MANAGRLRRDWWEPVRRNVLRFAGIESRDSGSVSIQGVVEVMGDDDVAPKDSKDSAKALPMPERIVITYISRQGSKRHLIEEDHIALVDALEDLADRKGWYLNVVQAERLTKDEQVQLMGETTVGYRIFRRTCHSFTSDHAWRTRQRSHTPRPYAPYSCIRRDRDILPRGLRTRLRMDDSGSWDAAFLCLE